MFRQFNKLEKAWIFYDVGNSAFTMLTATLIPIPFNSLATKGGLSSNQYLEYWSYAISLATVLVAVIGPVCGTIADNKGFKKPMFKTVLFIGVIGCLLLGFIPNWILFLITYIISKVCYHAALVFYDSMLPDITEPERMDLVSAQGYAWGYIGSCIPFIIAIGVYALAEFAHIIPSSLGFAIGFTVTPCWWLGVTVPLLRNYRQIHYVEPEEGAVRESFVRLSRTLKHIAKEEKKILYFLIAFFFYIDGVYTIIDEVVAISTALGLNQLGLLIVLLVTQIVAFAFAMLFGKLSGKYSAPTLINVCIGGYIFIDQYMGGKDYQVINDTTGEVMQTLSQHTAAEDRARWLGQSTEYIGYEKLKEIRMAQKKNHNAC